MTVFITAEQLNDIVREMQDAGDYEINVRTDYSGRGMYGDECIGFVTDYTAFTLGLIMSHVLGFEEALELSPSEDQMGRSSIVYFRNLQLAEGETFEQE